MYSLEGSGLCHADSISAERTLEYYTKRNAGWYNRADAEETL
jgi:hypothetical protein